MAEGVNAANRADVPAGTLWKSTESSSANGWLFYKKICGREDAMSYAVEEMATFEDVPCLLLVDLTGAFLIRV
jgi:hypothetical protein